jgi:hypothetical protein
MNNPLPSIIDPTYFEILLEKIHKKKNYCLTTTIPGLKGEINAYSIHFPAFATDEGLKFVENGFQSSDEFFHKMYGLLGTAVLQHENVIALTYPVPPPPQLKGFLNISSVGFLVVHTDKGLALLYNDAVFPFMDMVKTFSTATPFENLATDLRNSAQQQLETCFYALLTKAKVKIPESIPVPTVIQASATTQNNKELIAELIRLLFRNDISQEEVDEVQADLALAIKSPAKYVKNNPDFGYLENEELFAAVLRSYLPSSSSDWKFDPEDLEVYISDLIDEPFALVLPNKETYSQDLFPFAEQQLAEKGLALLNYDTQGDSYEFLVVNYQDRERIIWLCQKFAVPIDRVS